MRLVLVGPIVYCLVKEGYREALWLFLVAGVSDALDGFLARAFKWSSRFGAIVDPLADKSLLVAVFIALTYNGLIPLWLLLVVFTRDLVIVVGALAYHMAIGSYSIRPSIFGKITTFTQITYGLILIVNAVGIHLSESILIWGPWVVAGTCLVSGGHYVGLWSVKYVAAKKQMNR